MHRFEIYKDKKGEFRFRFRAGNGESMFASEGYASKSGAMKAVASIKERAAAAETVDLTTETKAAGAAKPAARKAARPEKAKSDA